MAESAKDDRIYVSLEFTRFNFPPDTINQALALEPDHIRVKGEPWKLQNGKSSPVGAKVNVWAFDSQQYSPSIEDDLIKAHLEWMIGMLEPKKKELKEIIKSSGSALLSVVCYFYSTNPQTLIPPEILKKVAGLGLTLYF